MTQSVHIYTFAKVLDKYTVACFIFGNNIYIMIYIFIYNYKIYIINDCDLH